MLKLFLLLLVSYDLVFAQNCEGNVDHCTTQFSIAVQRDGDNVTLVCSHLDNFLVCLDRTLDPCEFIIRNTVMDAMGTLVDMYTSPPFNCQLQFAKNFSIDECSTQVAICAQYQLTALDMVHDPAQACRNAATFQDCMLTNTSSCRGSEHLSINVSLADAKRIFNECPYACGQAQNMCSSKVTVSGQKTEEVSQRSEPLTEQPGTEQPGSMESTGATEISLETVDNFTSSTVEKSSATTQTTTQRSTTTTTTTSTTTTTRGPIPTTSGNDPFNSAIRFSDVGSLFWFLLAFTQVVIAMFQR